MPLAGADESALVQDSLQLVIQVNGKLRGQIDMPASASREEVEGRPRQRERAAFRRRSDHPQSDRGARETGQHRRQLIGSGAGLRLRRVNLRAAIGPHGFKGATQ
jgi:hypothetical protein